MIDKRDYMVELLRFIAASYVAIFHVNETVLYISNWFRASLKLGDLGVSAFFVISRLLPSRKLQNKLLNAHNIYPWDAIPKRSVWIRKIKAWINYRVWQSPASYIKWRGACGMFDALSEINE